MSRSTATSPTRATTSRRSRRDVDAALALTKGRPPIANLAATMALEHFTAMLAHELIANPRHLAGGDAAGGGAVALACAEEIEHKGVAYDTWLHATRDWPRLQRWQVKALVMLITTRQVLRRARAGHARNCCGRTG